MGEALPEIHTKKYLIICALGRKKNMSHTRITQKLTGCIRKRSGIRCQMACAGGRSGSVGVLHTEAVKDQVPGAVCGAGQEKHL